LINVTKPTLPDLDEYVRILKKIWDTRWITNNGEHLLQLGKKLEAFLGVRNLVLVSNGTLALHLALKSLNLHGEVITTPFTFPATTNAIIWEGLTPVFADIDSETLNIDPKDVRRRITKKTTAILAVHAYGNPCQIELLQEIAAEHDVRLIFDGAAGFGVEYAGKSVFNYGSISTMSFHATKVFNTIEGGAVVAADKILAEKIRCMSDHGIQSNGKHVDLGTNAKMNEFQAAMGLCNLNYLPLNIENRKSIYNLYKTSLVESNEIAFQKLVASKYNYSYMPVLFKNPTVRDRVWKRLGDRAIRARKYFFPLTICKNYSRELTKRLAKKYDLERALNASERVLCLPIYPDLAEQDVLRISDIVTSSLHELTASWVVPFDGKIARIIGNEQLSSRIIEFSSITMNQNLNNRVFCLRFWRKI